MLPTCILYCNAGPGCLNCWQVIMLLRIANIILVLGRVYFRDSRSFTLRKLYGEAKIGQETKKGMANVQTIQSCTSINPILHSVVRFFFWFGLFFWMGPILPCARYPTTQQSSRSILQRAKNMHSVSYSINQPFLKVCVLKVHIKISGHYRLDLKCLEI